MIHFWKGAGKVLVSQMIYLGGLVAKLLPVPLGIWVIQIDEILELLYQSLRELVYRARTIEMLHDGIFDWTGQTSYVEIFRQVHKIYENADIARSAFFLPASICRLVTHR